MVISVTFSSKMLVRVAASYLKKLLIWYADGACENGSLITGLLSIFSEKLIPVSRYFLQFYRNSLFLQSDRILELRDVP
jgi:hypothetical protein